MLLVFVKLNQTLARIPTSGGRTLIIFWISLNLGWFLSRIIWNKTDSVVVMIAPADLKRCKTKQFNWNELQCKKIMIKLYVCHKPSNKHK